MRKVLVMWGVLDDSDIEWMMTHGQTQEFPSGAVLIKEGQSIDTMYVLLEGAFEVSVGDAVVARLLSGEIVGEVSFVDDRPTLATVKSIDAAKALAIPRDRLSRQLENDAGFAARFYRALAVLLADRLRSTSSLHAYGSTERLEADIEYEDELNPDILDTVALAGARFEWMMRRLNVEPTETFDA